MCSVQEKEEQFGSPSHLLDNLMQQYEEDIKKEYRLINEVKCPLGSNSLYISTGLSPARGFIPVVKVSNNKNSISFTKYEWSEFGKYEKQIIDHMVDPEEEKRKVKLGCKRCRDKAFKENTAANTSGTAIVVNDAKTLSLIDTFKLTFTYVYKLRRNKGYLEPVVKIEFRGVNLVLDRTSIKVFKSVRLLVKSRLQRLELLDFAHYYNSLLTGIADNKENIEDLKDYIEKLLCQFSDCSASDDVQTNIWPSDYTDCILEILALEFDKFKRDLGSLRNCQIQNK